MNTNTMDTVWLTSAGMQKLRAEHAQLKQSLHLLRRDIRRAKLGFEDELSAEKRLEQEVTESKLSTLESLMQRVKQVATGHSAVIAVGSQVRYRQDRTEQVITLVDSLEADPSEGRISAKSPLGSALMGKRAGDVAYMVTPVGERKFQIAEVK